MLPHQRGGGGQLTCSNVIYAAATHLQSHMHDTAILPAAQELAAQVTAFVGLPEQLWSESGLHALQHAACARGAAVTAAISLLLLDHYVQVTLQGLRRLLL